MSEAIYEVWAVTHSGDEAERRWFGERTAAVAQGQRIARSGFPEGAVSVWVHGPDREIVWAAGRKATSLRESGVDLDALGFVRTAAAAPHE